MISSKSLEYPTSSQIIEELKQYGFSHTFQFEDGKLICDQTGAQFTSSEIDLEASYRFEGASDPDDLSILYAFRSHDGMAGTIIDGFGITATPGLGDFFTHARDLRETSEVMKSVPNKDASRTKGTDVELSS